LSAKLVLKNEIIEKILIKESAKAKKNNKKNYDKV
jgi:hypothetical protein